MAGSPELAGARAELEALRGCLPKARVISGEAATYARLKQEASQASILHLATVEGGRREHGAAVRLVLYSTGPGPVPGGSSAPGQNRAGRQATGPGPMGRICADWESLRMESPVRPDRSDC